MSYLGRLTRALFALPPKVCNVSVTITDDKDNTVFEGDLEDWFLFIEDNNFETTFRIEYTGCNGETGIKKVKLSTTDDI